MGSNSDINGIVKTFNDLEEFRNQELNENENLVEIITRLENEIEELENIHAEKKTYIEHQNVIIQNLERDNKTLKSRNYCKDIEICDLRNVYQEVEDLNEENERNEKELSCYNNKIITLKETKVQLEETLIEKDNIILRNENQLNELEMKIIGCRKKVDKMSEENATTRTRQEDCERNLETSKLQNVQLTDKSRLIENAKQKSEEINKSNQYQIKQLRNDITKEATNNSKMQNRILNLETEQKNIKKENLQLKEKVMTLQHISSATFPSTQLLKCISGNEEVDVLAKQTVTDQSVPCITNLLQTVDLQCHIQRQIKNIWKREWQQNVNNKLFQIKPELGEWKSSYNRKRTLETALARIRLGHTNLTHVYLIKREEPPLCSCGQRLTIQHIIIECPTLVALRNSIFGSSRQITLSEVLKDSPADTKKVLKFLQYSKLLKLI
ncbi:interaptin-like [Diaphorina citri]|uniref:Interaptin-like n=1 Tax=Diaphorina citri TaxID=121845 RepID=A0A3Q0JC58_DIACI|nr:interaptin-like [Diaphorina citri]